MAEFDRRIAILLYTSGRNEHGEFVHTLDHRLRLFATLRSSDTNRVANESGVFELIDREYIVRYTDQLANWSITDQFLVEPSLKVYAVTSISEIDDTRRRFLRYRCKLRPQGLPQ